MSDAFRTLIVPSGLAELARALAGSLSARGQGMFAVPLSPTGHQPATHYISSGWIEESISSLLSNADSLYAACQAAGATVSAAQCAALVSQSSVSAQAPFDAIAQLGLTFIESQDIEA
jgi:hypothetical protein